MCVCVCVCVCAGNNQAHLDAIVAKPVHLPPMSTEAAVLINKVHRNETTELQKTINGFNRSKMINARTMHFYICRCLGE